MRTTWPAYFMDIARVTATRATCPRRSVGCVIVKDLQIVATGYNGSLPKMPHCQDEGCVMMDGHCIQSVHAELNAIARAAKLGNSLQGSTAYVTTKPCYSCFKALVSAGVIAIYYHEDYESRTNHYIDHYLERNPEFILEKL